MIEEEIVVLLFYLLKKGKTKKKNYNSKLINWKRKQKEYLPLPLNHNKDLPQHEVKQANRKSNLNTVLGQIEYDEEKWKNSIDVTFNISLLKKNYNSVTLQ